MHNMLSVSSNLGHIGRQTTELPALEHPKISPLCYNGENGVNRFACLFTYLRIIQNILMTCRFSGERSLPFWLLVIICPEDGTRGQNIKPYKLAFLRIFNEDGFWRIVG